MGQQITYTCDVCGAIKKEANHWWYGYKFMAEFKLRPLRTLELDKDSIVICGQACATKLLAEFMNEAVKS